MTRSQHNKRKNDIFVAITLARTYTEMRMIISIYLSWMVISLHEAELYDVTIIGGGPAGLYSAFYSGLRDMKTKIIEYQPQLGGKLHLYPEKIIWDVGGLPPVPGAKLREQLVQQGTTFQPTVVLNEKVVKMRKSKAGLEEADVFELHTASGGVHYSKTVIVAVGSGIVNPQKINIEGAERFEMTNLHYTVKSLERFKGKTVVISGGGNSAVDWAVELLPIAEKVCLACRRDQFTGHEAQVCQLLEGPAQCLFHTTITKLIPDKSRERIAQVELTNQLTGEVIRLQVDELIINHGYDIDSSLLDNSEFMNERRDQYYIAGNSRSETSVPGLYAAGDILMHDGKVHLIAGAFQDAANAVNQAKQYIQPDAGQSAMVSSHNEKFTDKNREIVKSYLATMGV